MKTIKYWLYVVLVLGISVSCRKDDRQEQEEPKPPVVKGETITLKLSAEIGFEEEQETEFKGLNFKIEAVDGKKIPRPQFKDGQEVEVHTVIREEDHVSSPRYRIIFAKTLKWKYDAEKKKLVLSRDAPDNYVYIIGFKSGHSKSWELGALLAPGTTMNYLKEVNIEGKRELRAVDGNVNDVIGELNVPYAMTFQRLTIDHTSPHDSHSDSYANAYVDPTHPNARFRPIGSLIAFKFGNAQTAGNYDFTPTGFTVYSDAWGDKMTVNLDQTTLVTSPYAPPGYTYPSEHFLESSNKWSYSTFYHPPYTATWGYEYYYPAYISTEEETRAFAMHYTFAPGHEPGKLEHGITSNKLYYAWVMPTYTRFDSSPATIVTMRGTSSRPETATYKDYTKTWFTDYRPSIVTGSSMGIARHGKVHRLTARVTNHVALPIEYVGEYNLAGGDGLTEVIPAGTSQGQLNHPVLGGVQPDGVQGPLRLSNVAKDGTSPNPTPHNNDQSGYYSILKVIGKYDANYNPDGRTLRGEMLIDKPGAAAEMLDDKYFFPDPDYWSSIFDTYTRFANSSQYLNSKELLAFGNGTDVLPLYTLNDHSQFAYATPFSTDPRIAEVVSYAIRFRAKDTEIRSYRKNNAKWNWVKGSIENRLYFPLPDNTFKCAYRYTRKRGSLIWDKTDNSPLNTQIIIDVVYLGEESSPTPLSTIATKQWWDTQRTSGKIITRTISIPGYLNTPYGHPYSKDLKQRGHSAWYGSSIPYNLPKIEFSYAQLFTTGLNLEAYNNAFFYTVPFRLWKRDPHQ